MYPYTVATTLAGLVGTSPGMAYIKTAVGIAAGGCVELTAVVGGLLFLPFLSLALLLSVEPAIATTARTIYL